MLAFVHARASFLTALAAAAFLTAACTSAFGPGYTIDKQEILVDFSPAPQPQINLSADYTLRNTGNQPLSYLEIRLPGRGFFHYAESRAVWDGNDVALRSSAFNSRNVVLLFPRLWSVSASHTLHLSTEYRPPDPGEAGFTFTSDAFFLPAEGWSPELLPSRGVLASGGVPPAKWNLLVRVPADFLAHLSGQKFKSSNQGSQRIIRAVQRPSDGYPFVVAGRYKSAHIPAEHDSVEVWTRSPRENASLRDPTGALVSAIRTYNYTFGNRPKKAGQLWIVECPLASGCFSSIESIYAPLIFGPEHRPSAEMASSDTVMVDLVSGSTSIAAAAAPSLASSWLGYGQNPGFYEQVTPLSALPAFAASRGIEAVEGAQIREQTIRRALAMVPLQASPSAPEDASVLRAKSFLFFYALQDRYGPQAFNSALSHMLYARRGGGFDLDDLISAFEEETHQNVAEFVRLWMKHPGVPHDFRERYENTPSAALIYSKENTP